MSRIVEFASYGPPEVLRFKDVPDPRPAAGEIRIRVKAIGLNRAESMWRHGEYVEPVNLPARLGYEAAGTIDALGEGVAGFEIGEPVNVIPNFSMNQYATYGDLIVVPVGSIVQQPTSLSFVEAASIWMMFVTVYGALVGETNVQAGQTVVIPAASSSIGLASIQVANMLGAVPIALTRTRNKKQQLLDAGAAHVVVTDDQDLTAEILRLTDGKGASLVFDPVGGPNFPKLLKALAPGGTVLLYGALSEEITPLNLLDVLIKLPTIKGYTIWTTSGDPEKLRAAVAFIRRGFDEGKLKPVIDRTYPFDEIVQAHRYMETNGQFGKIVAVL